MKSNSFCFHHDDKIFLSFKIIFPVLLTSAVYKNFAAKPGCMTWNKVTLFVTQIMHLDQQKEGKVFVLLFEFILTCGL